MHQSPYEKFRKLMTTTKPVRFEASIGRFKNLLEIGTGPEGNTLDQTSAAMDPLADKDVKKKLIQYNLDARKARFETLKRLRKLSLTDFNMIGGVAPNGSMGGSGGGDGYRPVSFSARS